MHENTVYILKTILHLQKKNCECLEKRCMLQLSTLLLALAEMRQHNKNNHLFKHKGRDKRVCGSLNLYFFSMTLKRGLGQTELTGYLRILLGDAFMC